MFYATIARVSASILVVLLVVGCQPAPSPAAPTTAPTTAASKQPVQSAPAAQAPAVPTAVAEKLRIGISGSFTGGTISYGINADRFIRMGIDDVNAKGGVKVGGKTYLLEAVTADDKATTEGGVEAARRLVLAEKVRFVMGPSGSATLGAQPFLEENKAMLFPYSVSLAGLGPKHPLTLATGSHSLARSSAIYQWLKRERPNLKTVTIVIGNDASSHSNAPSFQQMAANYGVTANIEYNPNNLKDYAPIVARIMRTNPDGLDIEWGSMGPALLGTMKSLYENKYQGQTWTYGTDMPTVREQSQYMEGFLISVLEDWRSSIVGDAEKALFQRYVKAYDEQSMNTSFIATYDGVLVLAQALEKAGTVDDTAKIANVLREGEWDTISTPKWGKTRFVGTQTFGGMPASLDQPVYLTQVKNGKLATFDAIGRPGLP